MTSKIETLPSPIPALAADPDLETLSYNLAWSWTPAWRRALAARLGLETLDPDANPLAKITRRELNEDARGVVAEAAQQARALEGAWENPRVAYFCAEFGIHPSLPIYSGGLGILAGDHLKAASDTETSLLGVGLLYRRGYFRQTLDTEGKQEHHRERLDLGKVPVRQVKAPGSDDEQLTVDVEIGDTTVHVGVWIARCGRVPLLLLDTDREDNPEHLRGLTHNLYVAAREARLGQEIVLGLGGARALAALGLEPEVYHLNEGHSALMLLERIGNLREKGKTLEEACDIVAEHSVFTIHTPVPAGNEVFDGGLFSQAMKGARERAQMTDAELFGLGRGKHEGHHPPFDMTAFCLRLSRSTNGVSQLHGRTAAEQWDGIARTDVIGLTNGVHLPTWLGHDLSVLLVDKGVMAVNGSGAPRLMVTDEAELRAALAEIPDDEWAAAHAAQKRALKHEVQSRLHEMRTRTGTPPSAPPPFVIEEDALVIGFARRFATYKRANLILSDRERLLRILNDNGHVQLVFAGKAHPADKPGQGLIQELHALSWDPDFGGKIVVLEGYDIVLGKRMTQGADIWLNNPRRPLEASGTSGMKAAMNGVPNLSILDGWWDEGFEDDNGWAIGDRDTHEDYQDANFLYETLERAVKPEFADKAAFIARQKAASASSLWRFSTARMVTEYNQRVYKLDA